MSAQQYRGSLASGGSFVASSQGIEVYGPDGSRRAFFGREVISGVRRDSQVVTVERHNDTIVTFTAASITEAVGLEQFVRDVILAPVPPPEAQVTEPGFAGDVPPPPPPPPLAFDAFDREPEPGAPETRGPEPPTRPLIVARPEPEDDFPPPRQPDLPPPTPTVAPPPAAEQVEPEPEPIAPIPPASAPPPPSYPTRPQAEAAPPPPSTTHTASFEEDGGGRRWWLWGCLGCGGLLVLLLICAGVLIGTGVIDPDDFDDDDDPTPTPFIIVVTPTPTEADDSEPTPTEDSAALETPTDGGGGAATATEDVSSAETPTEDTGGSQTQPPGTVLQPGETATVGGIEATYIGARIDTQGLLPPDAGREYLVLAFRMVNTNAEPAIVSSLLQFTLRDANGATYDVELFADLSTTLDAEIQPGDTLEGEIAFDVPQGGGSYTITFTDLFMLEEATWDVGPISN